MKNLIRRSILVTAAFSSVTSALADAEAEKILKKARYAATVQNQDLDGAIKKDGKSHPLKMYFRGEDIQFQFYNGKAWIKFHMRLKDGGGQLFEIRDGKTYKFDSKKLVTPILGTDFTYEDLALSFLYWKQASVVKQETIKYQKSDVLRLTNPSHGVGHYKYVDATISQKQGALMKVIGYNPNGVALKLFSVEKVMKVKGGYSLQQMKVTSFNPDNRKVKGYTYLNFKAPTPVNKPLR